MSLFVRQQLPLQTFLCVVQARDCIGTSPADIASKNNHTAAVELLCSVAANINVHTPHPFPYSQRWLK